MYDKVSIFVDRAQIGRECSSVADYLETANDVTDRRTGDCRIYGSLQGLKVSVYTNGVYLIGSLPKFLHDGCNIYHISCDSTKEAIEKIGDLLHIPVADGKVTGFEFGTNFVLKHEPQRYLCRLGDMPYLHRFQIEAQTLYYKGIGRKQHKVFTLYDKIADAKVKGMELPKGFEDANILRYEMRLKGKLTKQLNTMEVKASTLYNPTFFRLVCKKWEDSYFSISKTRLNHSDMSNIKTPTDAFNALVARLICQSEETTISNFIEELKQRKAFAHRSDYTRLRKKIEEISSKSGKIVQDDLIRELDDDVKNATAFL